MRNPEPSKIAKEIDLNVNQKVDTKELSAYISANTKKPEDIKALAEQLQKEENKEIKGMVETCIDNFYKENKEAPLSYLKKKGLLEIWNLGKELGIISARESTQKYDRFLGEKGADIKTLIQEQLDAGINIEKIKEKVNHDYGNGIWDTIKKVYEDVNEEYGSERNPEKDSNVWYIWVPLKYNLNDVNEKEREVVNDLVDELNNTLKKIEARPITVPQETLPDLKLREEQNKNIKPDLTEKNISETENLKSKEPILDTEDNDLSVNITSNSQNENKIQDLSDEEDLGKLPNPDLVERDKLNLEEEKKNRERTPKNLNAKVEINPKDITMKFPEYKPDDVTEKEIPILKKNFDELKDKIDHDVLTGDIDPTKLKGWKAALKKIQDDYTKKFPDDEDESSVLGDEYWKSRGIDLGKRKDDMRMLERKINDEEEKLCVDDLIEAEKCVDEVVVLSNDQEQDLTDQKDITDQKEKERQEKIDALLAKTNTLVERNILNDLGNRPETVGRGTKDEVIQLLTRIEAKIIPLDVPERYPDLGDRSEKLQNNLELAKDERDMIPTHPGIVSTGQHTGPITISSSNEYSSSSEDMKNIDAIIGRLDSELDGIFGTILLPEVTVERKGYDFMLIRKQIQLLVNMQDELRPLSREEKLILQNIQDDINKIDSREIDPFSEEGIKNVEMILRNLDQIKNFLTDDQKQEVDDLIQKYTIDRLQARQSFLKLEDEKLDLIAREEEAEKAKREEDKKYPIEKLMPKRIKFLETKNEIDESIKLNPENYTTQEQENVEKLQPWMTTLGVKNMEDEITELEMENRGVWNPIQLDKILSRVSDLLTNATNEYDLLPDTNPYKSNLKNALDRLQARQSLLTFEADKLDVLARDEKAREEKREEDKKYPLEKMISKRTKFLENKVEVGELMKLNPDNYTQAEKFNIEKLKPLTAALSIRNFEDEIAERETENTGVWTKESLDEMLGRLTPLLTDATEEYILLPEDNPYKKNLKDAIDRLQAKQSLLKLEAEKLDLLAREEKTPSLQGTKQSAYQQEHPLEKFQARRAKFLETKNEINEDMKLNPINYTEAEKLNIEKLKPLTTALEIRSFEDEIAERETENNGIWTKESLDGKLGRLNPLLTNAQNEYRLIPDDNEYKKNLKDAIDRLQAKQSLLTLEAEKLDLLAREEKAKEEKKQAEKEWSKANPLEKLEAKRIKFLETKNEIDEDMKLNPINYTQAEKLNIERMKPLSKALELRNMDDEIVERGLENNDNRNTDELNDMKLRLNTLLADAGDLLKSIPESNPYKKNLDDALNLLQAKNIIINNRTVTENKKEKKINLLDLEPLALNDKHTLLASTEEGKLISVESLKKNYKKTKPQDTSDKKKTAENTSTTATDKKMTDFKKDIDTLKQTAGNKKTPEVKRKYTLTDVQDDFSKLDNTTNPRTKKAITLINKEKQLKADVEKKYGITIDTAGTDFLKSSITAQKGTSYKYNHTKHSRGGNFYFKNASSVSRDAYKNDVENLSTNGNILDEVQNFEGIYSERKSVYDGNIQTGDDIYKTIIDTYGTTPSKETANDADKIADINNKLKEAKNAYIAAVRLFPQANYNQAENKLQQVANYERTFQGLVNPDILYNEILAKLDMKNIMAQDAYKNKDFLLAKRTYQEIFTMLSEAQKIKPDASGLDQAKQKAQDLIADIDAKQAENKRLLAEQKTKEETQEIAAVETTHGASPETKEKEETENIESKGRKELVADARILLTAYETAFRNQEINLPLLKNTIDNLTAAKNKLEQNKKNGIVDESYDKNIHDIETQLKNIELRNQVEKEIVIWHERRKYDTTGKYANRSLYENIARFLVAIQNKDESIFMNLYKGSERQDEQSWYFTRRYDTDEKQKLSIQYALGMVDALSKGVKKLSFDYPDSFTQRVIHAESADPIPGDKEMNLKLNQSIQKMFGTRIQVNLKKNYKENLGYNSFKESASTLNH